MPWKLHSVTSKTVAAAVLLLSATVQAEVTDNGGKNLFPESTTKDWMSASYSAAYHEGSAPYKLGEYLKAFGSDEAAIRKQMGTPLARHSKEVTNRHQSGVTDTVVTLIYDGLTIEILEAARKTFINKVYIENCELNSPFQRYLCQPVDKVKSELGKPNFSTDQELIYTLYHGDIGTVPARLGKKDGKVSWIYLRNLID